MNINNPIFRHALNYGIALGITLSVFELISYFLGIHTKPIMRYINIVLTISMLVIATKKYRDDINAGVLPFGQAFLVSFLSVLFAALIFSIYRFVEFSIDPTIADDYIIEFEEDLLKGALNEDMIETWVSAYSLSLKPAMRAFSTIFQMTFWGSILSLILAAILKREGNPLLTDSNL